MYTARRKFISKNLSIEDIHRIREERDEMTKDMSVEEKVTYYNSLGKEAEREIAKRRAAYLASKAAEPVEATGD